MEPILSVSISTLCSKLWENNYLSVALESLVPCRKPSEEIWAASEVSFRMLPKRVLSDTHRVKYVLDTSACFYPIRKA